MLAVVLLLPNGHTLTHMEISVHWGEFSINLQNFLITSQFRLEANKQIIKSIAYVVDCTHTHTNLSIVCASIKLISATHEIFERCNECDKVAAHFLVFFFFSPCDCVLINCSASQLAAMTTTGTGPIGVPVGVCASVFVLGYYAMTSKCSTKATQSSVYKLRIT